MLPLSTKRDWTRPVAWALAAYAFGSIITMTNDVDISRPIDAFLASLILALAWAVVGAVGGLAKTIFTRRPTGLLIPFWTAPIHRSILFFIFRIAGLVIKSMLFYLGIVGVILLFVFGFATLGTVWPTKPKVIAKEQ